MKRFRGYGRRFWRKRIVGDGDGDGGFGGWEDGEAKVAMLRNRRWEMDLGLSRLP